ncbi:hypothetical protein llap_1852 [Limosa lapponica baueri]|uniref:Uncharacterized protein n=1 Tax=Limosa lapponica baueri TaxID=1758121 RepID=A0A2I0UP97_LIMLA|nr:hypothetical protein llap_1852 [Limosa lapponica baueri]
MYVAEVIVELKTLDPSMMLVESWVWVGRGGEEEELDSYFFYNSSDGLLKRPDPQIALTDAVVLTGMVEPERVDIPSVYFFISSVCGIKEEPARSRLLDDDDDDDDGGSSKLLTLM